MIHKEVKYEVEFGMENSGLWIRDVSVFRFPSEAEELAHKGLAMGWARARILKIKTSIQEMAEYTR